MHNKLLLHGEHVKRTPSPKRAAAIMCSPGAVRAVVVRPYTDLDAPLAPQECRACGCRRNRGWRACAMMKSGRNKKACLRRMQTDSAARGSGGTS
jgi:hypothetical protein